MKRKIWLWILSLLMTSMFASMQVVYAAETASLTAVMRYHQTPIADMNVRIYKIADMEIPSMTYTVDAKWNITAEDLNAITTASDNEKTAEKILSLIQEKNIKADQTGITDETGSVTFTALDQGVYLLEADDKDGYAIVPALIYVPMQDEETKEWKYEVTIYPKTSYDSPEIPQPSPTPAPSLPPVAPPDTSDPGIEKYAGLLAVSVVIAGFAAMRMHAGD